MTPWMQLDLHHSLACAMVIDSDGRYRERNFTTKERFSTFLIVNFPALIPAAFQQQLHIQFISLTKADWTYEQLGFWQMGRSDEQHITEQWVDLISNGCPVGFKTKSASDILSVGNVAQRLCFLSAMLYVLLENLQFNCYNKLEKRHRCCPSHLLQ